MEIVERPDCNCLNISKDENKYYLSYENESYRIYGEPYKGNRIILKYCGKLITSSDEPNNQKIFLHYGFGNLWENKGNIEMSQCKHSDLNNYCAIIELNGNSNFMFCFMDKNNNWDLNNSSSYELKILDKPLDISRKDTEVIASDDEFLSGFEKFLKKISESIYNILLKIGHGFEKNTNTK